MVGRWMIIRCEGAETAAKNAAPSHAKSYLSRKTVLPLQGFKSPIGFCGFGYQLFILFLCKSLQIWCNCHTMIKSSPARSSFIMVAKIIDTARTNPWWFNNKQFYQTILDYLSWLMFFGTFVVYMFFPLNKWFPTRKFIFTNKGINLEWAPPKSKITGSMKSMASWSYNFYLEDHPI